ncbi:MAG TPA: hypothetical protein VIS49_06815 [Cyclobacteriaceae bacterium]
MDDFNYGTPFGTFIMVKINLSNRDLLLLFGILIAVVVTLTTIVFNERAELKNETSQKDLNPNTSLATPSGLIKKAIDKIDLNPLIR